MRVVKLKYIKLKSYAAAKRGHKFSIDEAGSYWILKGSA
jgi:hypothetical protein